MSSPEIGRPMTACPGIPGDLYMHTRLPHKMREMGTHSTFHFISIPIQRQRREAGRKNYQVVGTRSCIGSNKHRCEYRQLAHSA